MKLQYKTEGTTFYSYLNGEQVCHCTIAVEGDIWTITAWYTKSGYGNQGIGTQTMKYALQRLFSLYGEPRQIEYVWNGANEYVYDWLETHFEPISKCPIAVQKTQSDDDWESHIYRLNTRKVLQYFEVL